MSTSSISTRIKGFSLVELIISVALFSIVAMIAASAYLNLVAIDRTTRATSDLVNNMTFVMNSIASNLRTGYAYRCTPTGPDGNGTCTTITFTDAAGCDTSYIYLNHTISINQTGGASCTESGQLVDTKINITDAKFILMGNTTAGDIYEPQIIIYITGSLNTGSTKTSTFTIQTTATQRGIDIP